MDIPVSWRLYEKLADQGRNQTKSENDKNVNDTAFEYLHYIVNDQFIILFISGLAENWLPGSCFFLNNNYSFLKNHLINSHFNYFYRYIQ